MRMVTLGIATERDVNRRALAAFKGRKQGSFISFATADLLFHVMTPRRWTLVRVLLGAGPMTVREAARRVGRDVKAVHGDVQALLKAGVLNRTAHGRIEFPFDAIHIDVTLKAA